MNGLLSQEEINALLKETTENVPESNTVSPENTASETIDDMEKDVLGELANISMGSAATALSSLIGKKTSITTPKIVTTTMDAIYNENPQSYITVNVDYSNGLIGSNVLILHTRDASVLADLILEGDGSNPPQELNEQYLNAINNAMGQMMNASTSALNQILNRAIQISSPVVNTKTFEEGNLLASEVSENVVKISFDLTIEGLLDSEMLQIIPVTFAKQMVSELCHTNEVDTEQRETKLDTDQSEINVDKQVPLLDTDFSNDFSLSTESPNVMPTKQTHVEITSAQFPDFGKEVMESGNIPPNLNLIMDISLQLSVEIGRTNKKIKEVLKLTNGSIVELDKLAGEPVDILINDKLLAKGEVIIIDENFGVRVTEIVSPSERIKNLK